MIKLNVNWENKHQFCEDYFKHIKKCIKNLGVDKMPDLILASDNGTKALDEEKLRAIVLGRIDFDKIDSFEKLDLVASIYSKTKKRKNETAEKHEERIKNELKNELTKSEDVNYWYEQIKLIEKCFDYTKFLKKEVKEPMDLKKEIESRDWRHKILIEMDVKICPYCNRNFIDNYFKPKKSETEETKETKEIKEIKEIKEHSSADLDHFYSQNKYPYLALSLYNFIPSCSLCNRNFKGDNVKRDELLYLYDEGFDEDCYFSVGENFLNVYVGEEKDFKIELNVVKEEEFSKNLTEEEKQKKIGKIKKINNNIERFNLESIYQNHSDEAKDILNKKFIYGSAYKDMLNKQLNLNINEDELFFGVYAKEKDLKKHISKFKRDIFEQK